jgi:hypothetical protein
MSLPLLQVNLRQMRQLQRSKAKKCEHPPP